MSGDDFSAFGNVVDNGLNFVDTDVSDGKVEIQVVEAHGQYPALAAIA